MYGVLRVGLLRVGVPYVAAVRFSGIRVPAARVRVPAVRAVRAVRAREQRLHLARRRLHHRVAARTEGERGAAFGDDCAREVDEDRRQFVAVQVEPDRVPRVRH